MAINLPQAHIGDDRACKVVAYSGRASRSDTRTVVSSNERFRAGIARLGRGISDVVTRVGIIDAKTCFELFFNGPCHYRL